MGRPPKKPTLQLRAPEVKTANVPLASGAAPTSEQPAPTPPVQPTVPPEIQAQVATAIAAGDINTAQKLLAQFKLPEADPNAFVWPIKIKLPGSRKIVVVERGDCFVCYCAPHTHVNMTDKDGRRYRIENGVLLSARDFPMVRQMRDPRWCIEFGGDPRGRTLIVAGYSAR